MANVNGHEVTNIEKVQKGRMVMIYATVDGEDDVHVASAFHDWKTDALFDGLKALGIEEKPVKKGKAKVAPAKVAPKKGKK